MQNATFKGLLFVAAATFGSAYGMDTISRTTDGIETVTTAGGIEFVDTLEVAITLPSVATTTFLEFMPDYAKRITTCSVVVTSNTRKNALVRQARYSFDNGIRTTSMCLIIDHYARTSAPLTDEERSGAPLVDYELIKLIDQK